MSQSSQHFYHPFKHSVLEISSNSHGFQNSSSFDILEDINLYHQPVEEPITAIIFFIVRCIFTIIAELCNYRVLNMMKKDTSVIGKVTKLQVYTIMGALPIKLIFTTLTDFIHPLNEVLGQWVCSSYWFIDKITRQIIAFHSLDVALLRYIFIVHDKKVREFGKERLQKIFWYLSFGIPILTILWVATDLKELDTATPINRCNGVDHKMFLVQSWSSLGLIKRNFAKLEHYELNDKLGKILAILRRTSKIAQRMWMILLLSNIAEGILYYKLIKHMRR